MWILAMWGWSIAGRWPRTIWGPSTAATEEVSRKLLITPDHASTMLRAMRIESWWGVRLCPKHSLIVRVGPIKVMAGLRESRINRLWVCWAVWWGWQYCHLRQKIYRSLSQSHGPSCNHFNTCISVLRPSGVWQLADEGQRKKSDLGLPNAWCT